MRVLVAVPHYFALTGGTSADGRWHGSVAGDPAPRVAALTACVTALHQLYGPSQHVIDHEPLVARPANAATAGAVDVVVCTSGGSHVLGQLSLPATAYEHRTTDCDP